MSIERKMRSLAAQLVFYGLMAGPALAQTAPSRGTTFFKKQDALQQGAATVWLIGDYFLAAGGGLLLIAGVWIGGKVIFSKGQIDPGALLGMLKGGAIMAGAAILAASLGLALPNSASKNTSLADGLPQLAEVLPQLDSLTQVTSWMVG